MISEVQQVHPYLHGFLVGSQNAHGKMFYIIKMANSDLFYARRAYVSSTDQWENQNNKTSS
jgi:hypothetical protein